MKIKADYANTPIWKEFNVKSTLPKELECLDELAHNMWWVWNYDAREMFRSLDEEIYEQVDNPDVEWPTRLICEGRHLFMSVDDRCGPPYTVVFDPDYEKICPWSDQVVSGKTWDDDATDAAVEVLASESNNREQRRARKVEREKKLIDG